MAAYNADIQIGVKGINNLRTLEQQLNRVSNSAKKISQTLQGLKVNQQTVKINTQGALKAVKTLEQRLNKLNKPVTVDVRYKETRRGSRSSSQPSTSRSRGALSPSQPARPAVEVQENSKLARIEERRKKIYDELNASVQKRNRLLEQQKKNIRDLQAAGQGSNARERFFSAEKVFAGKAGNKRSIGRAVDITGKQVVRQGNAINQLNIGIEKTRRKYEALTSVSNRYFNEERRRINENSKAWDRYSKNVDRAKKKRAQIKGAARGAGAAAAIGLSNVPGIGGIAQGAGIGAAAGGKAGLIGGAAVGGVIALGAGFIQTTKSVTEFNNALQKQQRGLANTVSTSAELEQALAAIDDASSDFLVPVGQATEQFTKLNAAARASGFSVAEVEKVYRGLAAANTALGGDSEKLQGILLATQQIFSKGKVQAEELRGQLGERLPGAFALFAKAVNKTPAELDKALNDGEVRLEDFIKFTDSLLARYEHSAKKIADAPENAGQRLQLAMQGLQKSMGPILQDLGNMFTNLATQVVNQLTRMFDAINRARTAQAIGVRRQAQSDFTEAFQNRQLAEQRFVDSDKTKADVTKLENARQGFRMARKALFRANEEVKKLTVPFQPAGEDAPPKAPQLPEEAKTKGSKGSTGSGPQDTTARTRVAIQLQNELLRIEREKFDLIGKEASLEQFALDRQKLKAQLVNDLALIKQSNITAESKLEESELRRIQHQTDLAALANREQEYKVAQTKAFEDQVKELQRGIELESATSDEMRRQLELKHALLDLEGTDLSPERKAELEALIKQRKELADRNADPIFQYMTQLQNSVTDTRGQIVSLAQTIESELASAMTSAVTGLIDGTTTVEEAFSSMLKNIGKAFIEMAMKILAQKAILAIIGAFAGGGNTMGGEGYYNQFTGVGTAGPNFGIRALGGPVTPKKPYLVGETGPELFIPSESGIIGTNAMFDAAAGAIKSGASVTSPEDAENEGGFDNPFATAANALVNTNNTVQSSKVVEMQMAQNAAIENPEPIDVKFQSTVINNVSYVSVEEFQAGLTQTANRARSMTLKDLRNKPSTRRATGVA